MEDSTRSRDMTSVFISYSHADEDLRNMLDKHLSGLKHQGLIDTWYDQCILAGDELDSEISDNLQKANLILFLVSADFISSKYCYDIEVKRAIERHNAGKARVIPVILRACDWRDTPFGKLKAVPKDGHPVRSWPNLDDAFLDIVHNIKIAIRKTDGTKPTATATAVATTESSATIPRVVSQLKSSNLRLRRCFSEADRDEFLESTFALMAAFFENSLTELETLDAVITTKFRRIDNNSFTAVIYQDGIAVSRSKVILGGMFGNGITFSSNDQASDNSCNENLFVENDDQNMFLKPLGMALHMMGQSDAHFTPEGAAEFYWSMLIKPLQ